MLCALVLFSQTGWTNVVIPHVKAILSSLMASVTDPDTVYTIANIFFDFPLTNSYRR